jgi:hypothetical protein
MVKSSAYLFETLMECGEERLPLREYDRRAARSPASPAAAARGLRAAGAPARRLLIYGASANLLRSKANKADPWDRAASAAAAAGCPRALANKTARIAWVVMLRQREYQPRPVAA